jgi:hypothetical protein
VAMIQARHLRSTSAITHKPTMQPKHLRPQHRHGGEQQSGRA